MSILGNGVDIVDNIRIKKSIRNNNFINYDIITFIISDSFSITQINLN